MEGEGCESYVQEAMRGAGVFMAVFMKMSGMGDSTENPESGKSSSGGAGEEGSWKGSELIEKRHL